MEGLVVGPKLEVTNRYGKSSSLRHCHQLSQASGSLALAQQEGICCDSIQKGNGSRIESFSGDMQHHSGVFADGVHNYWLLKAGRSFTEDLYRFRF